MIAQDLIQAAENAIRTALHRPRMLTMAVEDLAELTDRLLEMQGEPAGPLRDAGRRIANQLVTVRSVPPESPEDVLEALHAILRQATLVEHLIGVLPFKPATPPPAQWRLPPTARPRFAVIPGGLA